MNFTKVIKAVESGKLVRRKSWQKTMPDPNREWHAGKDEGGFFLRCGFYSSITLDLDLEVDDYAATDWEIIPTSVVKKKINSPKCSTCNSGNRTNYNCENHLVKVNNE